MSGGNVFLTGAAGAGKTYVLNEFIGRAMRAGKRVAVTASTGIAASHLGGTTIHSWSGLGILDQLNDNDLSKLGSNDRLIKRYNGTDVLVIDEISMLHGYRLDMINTLAKVVRASDKPFGGLQVVLVGDLFQLPPVSRVSRSSDFVHQSQAWQELDLHICYLTEQHRQQADDELLALLEAMRTGTAADYHDETMRQCLERPLPDGTVATRLYAHNIDVDTINQRHLAQLSGPTKTYRFGTSGSKAKVEQLAKGLLVPPELELKVGAEVMFVVNNFAEGYVNGSRGRIVDFDGDVPLVRLLRGRTVRVEPHTWTLVEDGRSRAEISQLPLRLAWAITIHKSQGMSLDAAEIDLSRAFTPGMGYVALSRVRSLDGLYLRGINRMALCMHPEIFALDKQLRQASQATAAVTADIKPEAAAPASTEPVVDEALFDSLKRWRLKRSKAEKVAPFMIAHNTTLSAVAAAKPETPQQLLGLHGLGAKKVEAYGPDILSIVAAHQSA